MKIVLSHTSRISVHMWLEATIVLSNSSIIEESSGEQHCCRTMEGKYIKIIFAVHFKMPLFVRATIILCVKNFKENIARLFF